jgi:hypothetical protein
MKNQFKQRSMAVLTITAFMLCGLHANAQDTGSSTSQQSPGSSAQQSTGSSSSQSTGSSTADNPPLVPGPELDSARKASDSPSYTSPLNSETPVYAGYETKQTAEFGGRITGFGGNQGVWDTYVNLGSGPRLLEYSLDMHSPTHTGLFFDDLSLNNFGYGGDPNDMSRLRVGKGTLYNFNALFRRDQNIFDYNLLANPLNPPTSNPNVPVLDSPHEFLLTRRMTDLDLSLFTLAPVRLKLGWSRVVNEGSTFSSIHEGTDASLFQPTLNTSDTFHFGVALRFIPKTSLNFDQYYTYFKGDTTAGLNGAPFLLAGGTPVNLGLPFNTTANQPCATPLLATGLVNPTCNAFLGYTRTGRNRNSYPTEQLSLQSNFFQHFDISARFIYSDAEANVPDFNETFNGLITRTGQRAYNYAGNATSKRITKTADFGITYKVTDKLRLIDSFRFNDFSIPGAWSYVTTSQFGANLLTTPVNPAGCNPAVPATCPVHTNSSSADLINEFYNEFLRQDSKMNTFQVEYDFTRHMTAYVGYRYENREITRNDNLLQVQTFLPSLPNRGGCPVSSTVGGVCTLNVTDNGNDFIPINANSALFGFSAHPTDKLRVNADMELYYADNTLTRISPRHLQFYRLRGTYKARDWMTIGGAVNIRENRNADFDIGNFQHNRSYAFTTVIAPPQASWGVDLTYNYNDIFSQSNICFAETPSTAPLSPTCGTPFLTGVSTYSELTNFGSISGYFKPARRVTANVGYNITSSTGDTLILNPNAPTGPLSFNYHLPMVMVAVELARNLTYKTGWNYYDYNEKSAPGPTLPRDFHGNVLTLSLRYTM